MSNSFNWFFFFFFFNGNIFLLFSFISGGRSSDLCHFSLVCSVVLGFSSVLILVFTLVFIQGSLCFVSVECILLRFS